MEWKSVGKAIGKFAPILGKVLGGPGPAVGGLISVVANAFGITDPDPTADQLMKAIEADPQAALKLMTVQENNSVELTRRALQSDIAYLEDRQNARARQVASETVTGKKDINLYALAWLIIAGFFSLITTLCFKQLPADSSGVIFMLFGSLSTAFGCVIQYFFGSSKSSADKTKNENERRNIIEFQKAA